MNAVRSVIRHYFDASKPAEIHNDIRSFDDGRGFVMRQEVTRTTIRFFGLDGEPVEVVTYPGGPAVEFVPFNKEPDRVEENFGRMAERSKAALGVQARVTRVPQPAAGMTTVQAGVPVRRT